MSRLMISAPFDTDFFLGVVTRRLPSLLTAASVLCLGYAGAQIFWQLVEGPRHQIRFSASAGANEAARVAGDFSLLERVTPFQLSAIAAASVVSPQDDLIDAPETDLDLTLHGIIASGDEAGRAIISSGQAAQKNYSIGDTVENAGGAVISRIYADSVLLDRDGTIERLRLNGPTAISPVSVATVEAPRPVAPPPAAAPMAETPSAEAKETNASARLSRSELLSLPEALRFDPDTGDVGRGVSIFVQRSPQLVRKAGLRPGDVILEAGGLAIEDYSDITPLIAQLENETEFEFLLVRNGERRRLKIRVDEDFNNQRLSERD